MNGSIRRHAWRTMVRSASLVVPAEARAEWRREWDAELYHVQARGGPVLRTALGAFADALELGIGPRAFADAARYGHASLARSPLHVAGAAVVLATGIAAAGVCLALAWQVAASLIRRAIDRHASSLPCTAEEARAAAAVLCAAAGTVGLLLAAAATARFPGATNGWSLLDGAARMAGPVLLSATLAAAAVRRWAAPRIEPR